MATLTKENTVLNTSKLTNSQKGIVFDIISSVDDWLGWDRNEFIRDWGNEFLGEHNTLVLNQILDESDPYNSEKYFKDQFGDETERTEITFEQWVELHKPEEAKQEGVELSAEKMYDMYLDYVENYTLLTEFAEAYNISRVKAGLIINWGRETKKLLNTLSYETKS